MKENLVRKNLAVRGQLELSPPDVFEDYQKKLAFGWHKDEYLTYRREWSELPAQKIVREYPLEIGFQMTTACNLKCHMCTYATAEHDTRNGEYISFDLITKIIDEVAGKVYSVKFGSFGETTLHPQLIDAIAYAKSKGIPETSLITNGSRLTPRYSEQLIVSGLDWLIVSVDGIGATYEKIRYPLKFNDTLKKLEFINSYKRQHSLVKPVVKVSGVWPAVRKNTELFYDTLAPLVDLVAFNPLCDLGANPIDVPAYQMGFACPHFWQRMFIGANGNVLLCCNDYDRNFFMGDAASHSIHELWHGAMFTQMRELHSSPMGFTSMRPCKYCFMGLQTEFDEMAVVHGREVWVENFVGLARDIEGI